MTVILDMAPAPTKPVYSPRDLLQQYYNLTVHWQLAENVVSPISPVKVCKYLLADEDSSRYQSTYQRLKDAQRAHRSKRNSLKMEVDQEIQQAIRRAHTGKGTPADHITSLMVLIDRNICSPTQGSLQTYADNYLGMDCSGFATAYFRARNRLGAKETLNIGNAYKFAVAVRESLSDVQPEDCLIWWDTKKKDVKTGYGHIALVQRGSSSGGQTLSVVEATGGGVGVVESEYEYKGVEDGVFHFNRPRSNKEGFVKIVQAFH